MNLRVVGESGKYEAYQHHEDDPDAEYPYFVSDPVAGGYLGPKFTEAQAEVIAFALNAVADGHALAGIPHERDGVSPGAIFYEGPTEGIAP